MRFYITIIIAVLVTGVASVGFGANGTLILSLKNPESNGPIPWGRVFLKGPVSAAKDVNSAGEIEFLGLPSGKYIIQAGASGFQPFRDVYELDFSIRKRAIHTILMQPNKPISFSKGKKLAVSPESEQSKAVEKPISTTAAASREKKKEEEIPKLQNLPLPVIPVPALPVIPTTKTQQKKVLQKKTEAIPGEIIHKNITQEGIVDDVDSTVSAIREREEEVDSSITLLHLGAPLMVSLNYSDRSGLTAENPVSGMIVTGIVGMLALLLAGIIITVVILARKSMLGLFKLIWCGCSFILLLLSVASWLAFAGFGVALFDVRVKQAAEERYRIEHQIPPDQEPGEGSDVIIVPAKE